MSYFLGISSLDCDVTISIVKDGKLVYAAQEERFTRKKQQDGFPLNSIKNALEYLSLDINDIKSISYGWYDSNTEKNLYKKNGEITLQISGWQGRPFFESLRHWINFYRRAIIINPGIFKKYDNQLIQGLKQIGYNSPLVRFNHQDCHAASAYFTSGWEKCLIFTLDGYGSGSCGAVFLGDNGHIKPLKYINSPQSLGSMYARVTKSLGFIPNRHEGKVLGLAAYGNPDLYFEQIMKDFELTENGYIYHNALDPWKYNEIFKKGKREDIAAAFQKVLEVVVVHWVKQYVEKEGVGFVCLAGGVAANVKMNQRILEISKVNEVYIHPGMSDCGVGTGSAFLDASRHYKIKPYLLDDVYLGPDFSDDEIKSAIVKFNYKFEHYEDIETKIAELLAEGKVVGRFSGRMEYGPRALCNRSILAPTQDNGINKWLNVRLKRNEFMPFAPVTLDYMAEEMYINIDKVRYSTKFMTTTVDCTEAMKRLSPAAVHVDGTARPQLVNEKDNKSAYKILNAYYKLTGIPSLVNTSFNMHEEPIICNPYDAVKSFKDGRLDYLAIGNYLLRQ